jgi:hypothetical protein
VTLEVDGVPVLAHVLDGPLSRGQFGLLAWGEQGGAEFSEVSVCREEGTAFVVMQLSDDRFQELYKQVIQEVCKEFQLVAFLPETY